MPVAFVSDSICNEYNNFNETNYTDDGSSFTKKELYTLCVQFTVLDSYMIVFMIFSVISIIFLCLMLVFLIRSWKHRVIIICHVLLSSFGLMNETMCILFFAVAVNISLQGNCDYVTDYYNTNVSLLNDEL